MFKYFFLIGVYFRNKKIFKEYNFLKKAEFWSLKELKQYQLKELLILVKFAYENSLFYKRKVDEIGLKIDEIKTLNDITKLPILTKEELKKHSEELQIKDNFSKLFFSETSGSTGEPLIFYRNDIWDARHRAAIYRGYSWYNIKPWEKNGYFWGYNIDNSKKSKIKFLDFIQNRFRIFSYEEKEMNSFLKKLEKGKYLEGYSSMIYEVAKKINQRRIKPKFELKMIKGTSEKIFDKYKIEVKKAFNQTIISEYGAAEAGIIAFECPSGNMHITMENCIVEEVNGEILVTNLLSKSFPIIRYRLGDYIKLDLTTKCSCGMEHPIITEVMGRVGKTIKGNNQNYPSLTLYYVFKNLAIEKGVILNYQAVQNKKGKLELKIEQNYSKEYEKIIRYELKKYFKEDLAVNLKFSIDIKSKTNKQKDFISFID